ncbi:MAG: hypothetical protein ACI4FN_08470 [Acutalibacteraceae bacterium]
MNNTHIAVFAKHENSTKEYLFAVPDDLYNIKKGDILLVDTIKGEEIAIATNTIIEGENLDEIALKFGAYLPLKKVKAVLNQRLKEYAERQERESILSKIKELFKNSDLPF